MVASALAQQACHQIQSVFSVFLKTSFRDKTCLAMKSDVFALKIMSLLVKRTGGTVAHIMRQPMETRLKVLLAMNYNFLSEPEISLCSCQIFSTSFFGLFCT